MYSKTFEGVEIHISDKNHKSLLKRSDKDSFVKSAVFITADNGADALVRNKIPCALCESFDQRGARCGKCPLNVFRGKGETMAAGCNYVMKILIPSDRCIYACRESVAYRASDETKALKNLKTITEFLKSFKKE